MNYGSFWERWVRGVSWTWVNERYRGRLPEGFDATIMTLRIDGSSIMRNRDGRRLASSCTPVSDASSRSLGPVSVYLKRHYRLPWAAPAGGDDRPRKDAIPRGCRMDAARTRPSAGR